MRIRYFTLLFLFTLINLEASTQESLTAEDIWKNGKYSQRSVYGVRSMQDGIHYTTLDRASDGRTINQYSYETGSLTNEILSDKTLAGWLNVDAFSLEAYKFSDDETRLLISTEVNSIYRRSTEENYYVVDLKAKTARRLTQGAKQRHATFSPDGSKIAFIQSNNLYVQDVLSGNTEQITNDGELNKIIYGYTDWVYEEEFAFSKAFFWSPDSKQIAYYRFDETEVKEFHMPLFNGLYPEDYAFKYPKAGEDNSKVSIEVRDLEVGKTLTLDLGEYEYIPRIKWSNQPNQLAVLKMPRLQNLLEIDLVNTQSLERKTIYKEASDTYIEVNDDLTFYGDNEGFIIKSEKDGFFHLYAYDIEGENEQQLTSGDWEVHEFIGYDHDNKVIYFTASKENPMNTGIYGLTVGASDAQLLSPKDGTSSADFSTGFRYFILYHSTAKSPLKVSLHDNSGKEIRVLEDNKALREKLAKLNLSEVSFFDFETSNSVKLNGWMIKPKNFDPKKKYPVLMFVYGGPGSQTVTNSMGGNYFWHQLLAQQGYIVVSVDNRGTGSRGKQFRTQTYQQLGALETEDQIEAAKWLGKQSYVDPARIGIWGWSYGGYMSSLCLFKGADIFKTAIAVAPVSNWRYYDSIYTERYMGMPQDNASGYDENSPINHTDKLKGNYLLIHGTADDNVHFQNAVEMVDALIASDKQFDFYIYPDRNHGIYGGNTRYHLFNKMTNFISENL